MEVLGHVNQFFNETSSFKYEFEIFTFAMIFKGTMTSHYS